jgi:hypothetical protein
VPIVQTLSLKDNGMNYVRVRVFSIHYDVYDVIPTSVIFFYIRGNSLKYLHKTRLESCPIHSVLSSDPHIFHERELL